MAKFLFLNTGEDNRKREIKIVSDAEAETAEIYVCMPWVGPHNYDDDQRGVCVACGVAVRYRPYAPKRPAKVCIDCAPTWIAATRH